jgi:DNA-binding response OmpR family regulator
VVSEDEGYASAVGVCAEAAGFDVDSVASVGCALTLLEGGEYRLLIVQSSVADSGGLSQLAAAASCPVVVLPATFVVEDLLAGLRWTNFARRPRSGGRRVNRLEKLADRPVRDDEVVGLGVEEQA